MHEACRRSFVGVVAKLVGSFREFGSCGGDRLNHGFEVAVVRNILSKRRIIAKAGKQSSQSGETRRLRLKQSLGCLPEASSTLVRRGLQRLDGFIVGRPLAGE